MEEGAALSIEIGGTAPGTEFDLIAAGGVASLDGQLQVTLINAFQPSIGDEFEFLMAAGGINGTFDLDVYSLPPLPANAFWSLAYEPTSVTLSVELVGQTNGDYNGDGRVNAADYAVWRKGLGTTYGLAHYDIWRANFGAVVGSGSNQAVPEPGAVCLALCCVLTAAFTRRRRENDE
jgi:hypothetical protein